MQEQSIQKIGKKDGKQRQKVKAALHNLKNVLVRNENFDNLHQYLCDLCQNNPLPNQLKTFDKMIRNICIRLRSSLKLVDQFVFAIKCLQSSTYYVQNVFSEEDFEKSLKTIQELMKRTEINDWIINTMKFIKETKKGKSVISQVKDKESERKMLEKTTDESKFKKKEKTIQTAERLLDSNNQEQIVFQFQAKKEQIKQRFSRIESPHKKHYNKSTSKDKDIKQDLYSQKQNRIRYQDQFKARKAIKHQETEDTEKTALQNTMKFQKKELSFINVNTQYQNSQIRQKLKESGQQKQLQNLQHTQIQKQTLEIDEVNDYRLIKIMFAIKNVHNLNFLKKAMWDECKLQIRRAEKIYSSEQIPDLYQDPQALRNKNILLIVQLINGIVVGGFQRQEKYIDNQKHRGFLFSLSKKEVFPILEGNHQRQLFNFNVNEIIFGRDELKIDQLTMIVSSNFANGKGIFDCKQKDIDYLLGEGSQKTAEIMEYAIYQIS